MPGDADVVLVSNRGPVSFSRDADGTLVARRGSGGLVSGLAPLVAGTDTLWVAAAMSDDDRAAAAAGVIAAAGMDVRLVDVDPDTYDLAYDVACNAMLWFTHHGLYDTVHRPLHDRHTRAAWEAYRTVNDAFADVVADAAGPGAVVLIQDYHLTLVARRLADLRPDLTCVHFAHTPFAGPDDLRRLPDEVALDLLDGLAVHRAVGFHTARWAARYEACCVDRGMGSAPTFASPLGPDPDDLTAVADGEASLAAAATLDALAGGRKLVVRVDRLELSKNITRGFRAFDLFLAEHPEWRERVTFAAFVYPSRATLPEYLAERAEVDTTVEAVNRRWGTADWTPIVVDPHDDYPLSIAALRAYDVLMVNPVRDGLNLVAKEGPLVNDRDGVVVLSSEAGAAVELADAALVVNPFDLAATADALHRALTMDDAERAERVGALRTLAVRHSPRTWFDAQVAAAGRSVS